MIKIMRASDLWREPSLATGMFADRRKQFHDRLGWSVEIDEAGYEYDRYELENPLYIILTDVSGNHAGSMRLLPTTGRTMINEHFLETLDNKKIEDPNVWECTRFCLAPNQPHETALGLLAVGARLMREAGISKLIGIFDERMIRLYRFSGVMPEILGSHIYKEGKIFAGTWTFEAVAYAKLLERSTIDPLFVELLIANTALPWCRHRLVSAG